jgi:FkbM family methyltransferase
MSLPAGNSIAGDADDLPDPGAAVRLRESRVEAGAVGFVAVTDADRRDDPVADALAAGSFPLPRLLAVARRCTPAGGRVLDLGSHVGAFALAAAASGFEVGAVEASTANAALLRAAVSANGFEERLQVVHAAVSDRPGTLSFHELGPYGHVLEDGQGGTTVEAVAVDDLLGRLGWHGVDFVKLDVEGSEVAAVRGMARLLAGEPPPVVWCESNGHTLALLRESPRSLFAAFEAAGLQVYVVEPERLVRMRPDDVQGPTVVDVLAVSGIPDALQGDTVVDKLSWDDQLAGLQASAAASLPERLHAARELGRAPEAFRRRPEAAALARALRADEDAQVRALASAIQLSASSQ